MRGETRHSRFVPTQPTGSEPCDAASLSSWIGLIVGLGCIACLERELRRRRRIR